MKAYSCSPKPLPRAKSDSPSTASVRAGASTCDGIRSSDSPNPTTRRRARVAAIEPGYYTRLGAALRMATRELRNKGSRERLLLLSDGKPNDNDAYEGRHGIEDTRQAFLEARRARLRPFCVTVDRKAGDYLPYLFGRHHFTLVRHATELPLRLSTLYAQLVRR